jgi:hypothetical protein
VGTHAITSVIVGNPVRGGRTPPLHAHTQFEAVKPHTLHAHTQLEAVAPPMLEMPHYLWVPCYYRIFATAVFKYGPVLRGA